VPTNPYFSIFSEQSNETSQGKIVTCSLSTPQALVVPGSASQRLTPNCADAAVVSAARRYGKEVMSGVHRKGGGFEAQIAVKSFLVRCRSRDWPTTVHAISVLEMVKVHLAHHVAEGLSIHQAAVAAVKEVVAKENDGWPLPFRMASARLLKKKTNGQCRKHRFHSHWFVNVELAAKAHEALDKFQRRGWTRGSEAAYNACHELLRRRSEPKVSATTMRHLCELIQEALLRTAPPPALLPPEEAETEAQPHRPCVRRRLLRKLAEPSPGEGGGFPRRVRLRWKQPEPVPKQLCLEPAPAPAMPPVFFPEPSVSPAGLRRRIILRGGPDVVPALPDDVDLASSGIVSVGEVPPPCGEERLAITLPWFDALARRLELSPEECRAELLYLQEAPEAQEYMQKVILQHLTQPILALPPPLPPKGMSSIPHRAILDVKFPGGGVLPSAPATLAACWPPKSIAQRAVELKSNLGCSYMEAVRRAAAERAGDQRRRSTYSLLSPIQIEERLVIISYLSLIEVSRLSFVAKQLRQEDNDWFPLYTKRFVYSAELFRSCRPRGVAAGNGGTLLRPRTRSVRDPLFDGPSEGRLFLDFLEADRTRSRICDLDLTAAPSNVLRSPRLLQALQRTTSLRHIHVSKLGWGEPTIWRNFKNTVRSIGAELRVVPKKYAVLPQTGLLFGW
jgi:hypothetical protein